MKKEKYTNKNYVMYQNTQLCCSLLDSLEKGRVCNNIGLQHRRQRSQQELETTSQFIFAHSLFSRESRHFPALQYAKPIHTSEHFHCNTFSTSFIRSGCTIICFFLNKGHLFLVFKVVHKRRLGSMSCLQSNIQMH